MKVSLALYSLVSGRLWRNAANPSLCLLLMRIEQISDAMFKQVGSSFGRIEAYLQHQTSEDGKKTFGKKVGLFSSRYTLFYKTNFIRTLRLKVVKNLEQGKILGHRGSNRRKIENTKIY